MSGSLNWVVITFGIACDIVYLCACALHGVKPDEQYARQLDLKRLYRMCQFHSLTAITCMALEQTGVFLDLDPAVVKAFKDAKAKAIRKNMLLDAEREQIFKEMEQAGIWHMPLKGSVLQALYPKYGMRQMSDNDILYDPSGQKWLADIMERRGYDVEVCGKSNHDVFLKPPIFNFEMHTSLFGQFSGGAWYNYYKNVKERLLADEGASYRYHFTDEDFYLYMTAHTYKHYSYSGVGLRSLVDAYVFTEAKGGSMDWGYIGREAAGMGIADFEERSRLLAKKLFSSPAIPQEAGLTKEEEAMFSYFAGSGTYGTTKNYVKNRMSESQKGGSRAGFMAKLHFIYRRLFPTMEWYQNYEPFFAKHKVLIPFFLVYRFFRRLFGKKKIWNELRAMREFGKEK